jgi:nicotinate-nucleotide pyrophosphorylase (carboxylating)
MGNAMDRGYRPPGAIKSRNGGFSLSLKTKLPHRPRVQPLNGDEVQHAVELALAEDVGSGDVTTLATVPESAVASAVMRAREPLVVAGSDLAEAVFSRLDSRVKVVRAARDGARLVAGTTLMQVAGPARAILTGERVALNFVQRLSGVASLTARFVAAIEGTAARILDTRKTTPGWRALEKHAVTCGGGMNHRFGLHDMILIKDNHLAVLRDALPNPVEAAVRQARAQYPGLRIEVEADTLDQVDQALVSGAEFILLDNMTLPQLREAAMRCRGRAATEASGGVSLETVRGIAETGVDFISVGALTHSARSMDIGLDFE